MRPGAVVLVAVAQVILASLPGADILRRFTQVIIRYRRARSRRIDTHKSVTSLLAQVRPVAV
jgi:hypothetical protein